MPLKMRPDRARLRFLQRPRGLQRVLGRVVHWPHLWKAQQSWASPLVLVAVLPQQDWRRPRAEAVLREFNGSCVGTPTEKTEPIVQNEKLRRCRMTLSPPRAQPRCGWPRWRGFFFTTTGGVATPGDFWGSPGVWRSSGRRKRSVCSLLSGTE